MGRNSDPLRLLSPKAVETLARLPGGEDAKGIKGTAPGELPAAERDDRKNAASPGGANTATGKSGGLDVTEEQYNKLPSGAAYTVPGDSTVRYKR
jgi:hypothetical protein